MNDKPINAFLGRYRFLSNFWPVAVSLPDDPQFIYKSVEHAYQAAKTLELADRVRVAETLSPGAAKRLGDYLNKRPDWKSFRLVIMEDLVTQKFDGRDPWLRKELVLTGDAVLREGNVWGDTFWGNVDGIGEDNLGKILMRVRSKILVG